jgi:predicted CXXCH cytochrome family protein
VPVRFLLALCALLLAAVLTASPARADDAEDDFSLSSDSGLAAKTREAIAACERCHSPAGLANPPRPDLDRAKLAKALVHPEAYDGSAHSGMDCKDCHTKGYADFPHPSAPGPAKPCGECHRRRVEVVEREVKASVHHAKHPGKFDCVTCHDPHVYTTAAKLKEPRRIVAQDNAMCADCHRSELLFSKFITKRLPDLGAVHGFLPNTALHFQAVRCIDCHTADGAPTSHEVLAREKSERDCVTCHSAETSLRTRLYRHLTREARESDAGFLNAFILTDAYLVGATRNLWLDRASFVILALLLGGIGLHAGLRVAGALKRRRGR